jgi:hypothetical protein
VLIAKTEKCKIKKFTDFTVWLNACSTALHVYKKRYLRINAVAQPIDLDPAPPQNEPVSPVNDPIENEQLQAPNLDLDVILLFILVFVCIVACFLRV